MGVIWPLHVATGVVVVPMVFSLRAQQKKLPKIQAEGLIAKWCAEYRLSIKLFYKLFKAIPLPLTIACAIAFVYAIVNFDLFTKLMEDGSPAFYDNRYFLHRHGEWVRDLSREEYQRYLAYEVRGFSGHWMIFSLLPTVYFLVARQRLAQSSDVDNGESV